MLCTEVHLLEVWDIHFQGIKTMIIFSFFGVFLASLWLRRVNQTASFMDFLFLVVLPRKRCARIDSWDLVREKNKKQNKTKKQAKSTSDSYVFVFVSQGLVWLYEWSVLTSRTYVRTLLTLPTCSRSSSTLWMLWKRYVCVYIFWGCGGGRGETSFHALQIVLGVSPWSLASSRPLRVSSWILASSHPLRVSSWILASSHPLRVSSWILASSHPLRVSSWILASSHPLRVSSWILASSRPLRLIWGITEACIHQKPNRSSKTSC